MALRLLKLVLLFLIISSANSMGYNFGETDFLINFVNKVQEFLENENNTISSSCKDHMLYYLKDLQLGEIWALEMFDSGAKLPSGILEGNTVDLGSFDECLNIEKSTNTQNIYGKYCISTAPNDIKLIQHLQQSQLNWKVDQMSRLKIATPDGKPGMQLATCMPDSCGANEMQEIYTGIGFNRIFYEVLCQTKSTQPQIDTADIATLCVFAAILLIIFISSIYEAFLYYTQRKSAHELFIAFSIITNGRKLISTTADTERFSCLDGIRVITTMWIILSHTRSIRTRMPSKNSFFQWGWLNNKANMYLMGSTVCVDTFFVLTGFLITYSYMTMIVVKKSKFNIFVYYLHRYMRLTPVLAVIMVIHITLLNKMGSGPIWPIVQLDLIGVCQKNWWKTLLYIQNYGVPGFKCVPQSWYLSIDMQLVVLSPLLLIPLIRWPKRTLAVTLFLTVCSMVYCFLVAWIFELNMNIYGNRDPQKLGYFAGYYYFATPSRAATWLIGMVLGYIIFKTKQRKEKLIISRILVLALWAVSLLVLFVSVFAGHDLIWGKYDKVRNSLHMALVRPSWAVAVGWIIFACIFGYGGPVNWFLSLPIFQILSKLTFTLYMVHYTLIVMINARMREASYIDDISEMSDFWGNFIFSCIISIVLEFTVELPVIAIENFLFKGKFKEKIIRKSIIELDPKSSAAM